MSITFDEQFIRSRTSDHVTFEADVNGKKVTCIITGDALKKVNRSNARLNVTDIDEVIEGNKDEIYRYARFKIQNGQFEYSKIFIGVNDVK